MSTSSMMDTNSEHYGGALVQRRPQKGRMAALRDEPSKVSSPHPPLVWGKGDVLPVVCGLLIFPPFAWLGQVLSLSVCFSLDFRDM